LKGSLSRPAARTYCLIHYQREIASFHGNLRSGSKVQALIIIHAFTEH
jgi:hypothetical protein